MLITGNKNKTKKEEKHQYTRYHPFSTYAKFSKKLTFLTSTGMKY